MEPRFRGAKAVIARSFARIHETNLKKQGVLPLTFADPADYSRIGPTDKVSVVGVADLAPGRQVEVVITSSAGSEVRIATNHTFSDDQIEWFKAGSALNLIRQRSHN
jgi:aconitate hydratase